jgi:hypothetical protein
VTARRFPPPWSVEEQDACLVMKDSGGQKFAYLYFRGWIRFNYFIGFLRP